MGMSQLILYFQVAVVAVMAAAAAAAAGFTPTGEMERKVVEKGAKDFFKEGMVENLIRARATVVLEVVVVVVRVQEAVEGTPEEAVGIKETVPVEEGEVPLMMERISKTIAVTIQLVMAM